MNVLKGRYDGYGGGAHLFAGGLVLTVILALTAMAIVTGRATWNGDNNTAAVPSHSPKDFRTMDGYGSGHYFGVGVTYTIELQVELDGVRWAVVSSELSGEEDIQIWSQDPEILTLDQGSRFRFSSDGRVVRNPNG